MFYHPLLSLSLIVLLLKLSHLLYLKCLYKVFHTLYLCDTIGPFSITFCWSFLDCKARPKPSQASKSSINWNDIRKKKNKSLYFNRFLNLKLGKFQSSMIFVAFEGIYFKVILKKLSVLNDNASWIHALFLMWSNHLSINFLTNLHSDCIF